MSGADRYNAGCGYFVVDGIGGYWKEEERRIGGGAGQYIRVARVQAMPLAMLSWVIEECLGE